MTAETHSNLAALVISILSMFIALFSAYVAFGANQIAENGNVIAENSSNVDLEAVVRDELRQVVKLHAQLVRDLYFVQSVVNAPPDAYSTNLPTAILFAENSELVMYELLFSHTYDLIVLQESTEKNQCAHHLYDLYLAVSTGTTGEAKVQELGKANRLLDCIHEITSGDIQEYFRKIYLQDTTFGNTGYRD